MKNNSKNKIIVTKEDFNKWNDMKKQIHFFDNEILSFPQEREVWMCAFGQNIGHEQNGGGDNFSRPILVIKKFNNKMFWVIPLSTKQKKYDFYYNFTDPKGEAVSVVLAQLRLMNIKRLTRKLYEFSEKDFREISDKLKAFFP